MPKAPNLPESQVTDPAVYLRRRDFLRTSAAAGAALAAGLPALAACGSENPGEARADAPEPESPPPNLGPVTPAPTRFRAEDPLTPEKDAKSYNNFYEMGTGKDDPARNAHLLRTEPWSVSLTGEIAKPGVIALEDLLRPHPLEERIYRLRCVEAWSMVIPWVGVPLGDIIRRLNPGSKARYVAFETLLDPEQLPGQKRRVLDWPYREGLRMDEAMHPLTILAVGMYGQSLPGQNGAPLRLVVPWKYGFKSIKSIVGIRLQAEEPVTAWNQSAPREYGFYANVNPEVSHPRWSQARERRIGDWRKRPTLPFNGYGEQVASLYAGMDLRRNF